MGQTRLGTDLERRKQVRLRLRPDLRIEAHQYEGRARFVVKDPISLRYYWFNEQENFLLRTLDGRHTLDEVQQAFEENYRPERMRLEELEAFGEQLLTAGLVHNDSPQAGQQLFERRGKRLRQEWLQVLTNILYIKIPVFDPDRLLAGMLPWLRWIFTPGFFVLSTGFLLAAVLLVATHFETFWNKLPSAREFFQVQTVAYLWLALALVKLIHEFGHGLGCKRFGGECHEMGLLILCLSPTLYCNVSDAWTLGEKWKRILISFAGIYVELLMAALATFLWWYSSQPFLHHLSLGLMVVCSLNTLLINGNPLMRYDGYYVLADWLEIPNLRDQGNRYLKNLVLEHCLGIEVLSEPYMAPGRRVGFVLYVIVSYVYRWVVTFLILYFLYRFLQPYKLGTISALLAVSAAASLVGWPLYRLGRSLAKRGRLPEMNPRRVLASASVVLAVLLAVFLVPLPVGRIRQTALVEVQPGAVEKVFVPIPAILERVHVRDGQVVAKDDILAEFSSLELENQLAEARSNLDISKVRTDALTKEAAQTRDLQERAKTEVELAEAFGDRLRYARQLAVLTRTGEHLVVRAPRAGVVLGMPRKDELGKLWEKDQDTPFCTIGDPRRLRALVPVSPADYRLLKEEMEAAHQAGRELPATIRVQGREGDTWPGQVAPLPESEAKEVPLALTIKGGGPLAVQPGPRPNTFIPEDQNYLVAVNFLKVDRALYPGTLGKVKIYGRWHTCAWWLWRTASSTFDLGLI